MSSEAKDDSAVKDTSAETKQSEMDGDAIKELILKQTMERIYTQQHFNATAGEFVDAIFNVSIKQFTDLIPGVRKSLLAIATEGKSEQERAVISAKLNTKLAEYTMDFYKVLEKNCDSLSVYMEQNTMSIPPGKVLNQDKAQIHYKELVKILKEENSGNGSENYTEDTTPEILAQKVEKAEKELFLKKIETAALEHQIKEADKVLKRLESFEGSLSGLQGSDTNLKDLVLNTVANLPTSD